MALPSKPSPDHRTQIWLAIIGLIGILGGALIANWKNIFPPELHSPAGPSAQPAATLAPVLPVETPITIRSAEFINGTGVAMASGQVSQYGEVLMNMGPPYIERANAADFQFRAPAAGTYRLVAEYAAGDERPVTISLNGQIITRNGLGVRTGCFETTCQRWMNQGEVSLMAGTNLLRLERAGVFPHIRALRFEPTY